MAILHALPAILSGRMALTSFRESSTDARYRIWDAAAAHFVIGTVLGMATLYFTRRTVAGGPHSGKNPG